MGVKMQAGTWISRRRVGLVLGIGGVAVFVIFAYLIANPGSVSRESLEGGASIRFSADRRIVLTPGSCVNVQWQVEGIKAVFLNNEATVGSGERSVCIESGSVPTLHVIFMDDSNHYYRLDILILVEQSTFWLVSLAGLVLLVAGVYLWLTSGQISHFRGFIRDGTLIAAGVILTLFALELGLRVYFTWYGAELDRILYLYSASELQEKLDDNEIHVPLPYLNYGLNPDYEGHNRLGYRGPEIAIPKPEGAFRIVAMGDSITYGLGISWQDAYPAQLQNILHSQYGYTNVEVINAGVMAYSSWDTLTNLSFRVLELQPDLIIVYDGSNDAVARHIALDCYAGMNPRRGLDPTRDVWNAHAEMPSVSTLYRYVAVNLGWVHNPVKLASYFVPNTLCNPQTELSDIEQVEANEPIYFRRNLRNIVAVARMNEVEVLLSTQAYNPDATSEVLPEWKRVAADENNQVVTEVADELDTPYFDMMGILPHNADFWYDDGVHQSRHGAAEQARLYAAYLVENGLLGEKP